MITLMRNGISAGGTSLQGYIEADYNTLVQLFGSPDPGDGYKTQVDWAFEVMDEEGREYTVTIYDWKQGDCYLGSGNGTPPEAIKVWNVGGHNIESLWCVEELLRKGWSQAA